MRFQGSKDLYTYWLSLKGSRTAPERNEIEPNDIRNLLGDTFILEVNHQEKYVSYRLAGSRLCNAYGRELKGVGYFANWLEEDSFDVVSAVKDVYSNYIPNVISHLGQTKQNRFMEFETLLLPLQPIDGNTTRILGIASPKIVPFWLGAEPIVSNRLRSIRQMGVGDGVSAINDAFVPPSLQPEDSLFGEELQQSQNHSNNRQFGHLRVLDGGKN